jgi:formylglycine-generating enzyme required for sulfatase activity
MKKLFILTVLASVQLSAQIKLPKSLNSDFIFVPSGLTLIHGDTISVQSFYMKTTEVTNGEYAEFLAWLETNGTAEQKQKSAIRNEKWVDPPRLNADKYAEFYFKHPAYENYPLVNVTREGAELYCLWLEEKINLQLKDRKVKVRLPFHPEFIRAGAADNLNAIYSWKGPYLRNSKGDFLANFVRIPQSTLTKNEEGVLVSQPFDNLAYFPMESSDVIAPSRSYYPSELGFYNLNGNVAEMVQEKGLAVGGSWRDLGYDIRLQSSKKFDEACPDVGFRPVFTVMH